MYVDRLGSALYNLSYTMIKETLMMKYKVLPTLSLPNENLDYRKLEEALNEQAKEGWKVITCIHETIDFKNEPVTATRIFDDSTVTFFNFK